jgi:hypothetical protein
MAAIVYSLPITMLLLLYQLPAQSDRWQYNAFLKSQCAIAMINASLLLRYGIEVCILDNTLLLFSVSPRL